MSKGMVRTFFAGVLVANSAPHLASAVAGRLHMTPVGGKDSAPQVNLGWGLLNLAGGLALVAITARTGEQRWDRRLVAFDAGAATFAAWMAGSEALLEVNTSDGDP